MTKASFRFSPKILARLGEELNQTADQSIAELVKNAYDADATMCVIELTDVGAPGGSIVVGDDGDGMDADSIRDKWLVLGRSSKSTADRTTLGRTPAGSKGLGRLAALRMGTAVKLESIERKNSRRIHSLDINWIDFDDADVVEDVELEIETKKNTLGGHGTRTILRDLRTAVSSDELRRLARSLLLLTDPFSDSESGFNIRLVAPEFREIENLIRKKYFDEASYHLTATLDADGIASARILDWQSQELAKADMTALRRTKDAVAYDAPPASFDLWVFLLGGSEGFSSRTASKGEIQTWLRQFGGVYCYQDEIRVTPYGNPGNDWLEMNLSRVRSPEERPGTNTAGRERYDRRQTDQVSLKIDTFRSFERSRGRRWTGWRDGALKRQRSGAQERRPRHAKPLGRKRSVSSRRLLMRQPMCARSWKTPSSATRRRATKRPPPFGRRFNFTEHLAPQASPPRPSAMSRMAIQSSE
jgi:hypothetical protein